jgi:nitrogen-specific signal transduction histidine kinase
MIPRSATTIDPILQLRAATHRLHQTLDSGLPLAGSVPQVRNVAAPFSDGLALDLFQPFKRELTKSLTNRNGLGLSLYIAERVVAGHGGRLAYQYQHPHVMFTASFPLAQGQS